MIHWVCNIVMRHLTTFILTILLSSSILGQSTQDVIAKYSEKLSTFDSIHAVYTFKIFGAEGALKFSTDGEFFSQGEKFLVKTEYSDIYCDGESKYVYDKNGDEMVIMGHDPHDSNMSENPFGVLMSGYSDYTAPKKIKIVSCGGRECYLINLTPVSKKMDHTSVDVIVTITDYIVKRISYKSQKGETYQVDVHSISEGGVVGTTLFKPDLDSMDGVYVTDLR